MLQKKKIFVNILQMFICFYIWNTFKIYILQVIIISYHIIVIVIIDHVRFPMINEDESDGSGSDDNDDDETAAAIILTLSITKVYWTIFLSFFFPYSLWII